MKFLSKPLSENRYHVLVYSYNDPKNITPTFWKLLGGKSSFSSKDPYYVITARLYVVAARIYVVAAREIVVVARIRI